MNKVAEFAGQDVALGNFSAASNSLEGPERDTRRGGPAAVSAGVHDGNFDTVVGDPSEQAAGGGNAGQRLEILGGGKTQFVGGSCLESKPIVVQDKSMRLGKAL